MAGAMCRAIVSRILALYSTPSWFGTVNSTVSAACTASSAASSSAILSGSPAYVLPNRDRTPSSRRGQIDEYLKELHWDAAAGAWRPSGALVAEPNEATSTD